MFAHRLRRWPDIRTTLAQRLVFVGYIIPSYTRRCPDVGPTLCHRLRRWPSIGPTSGQCLVFARYILPRTMTHTIAVRINKKTTRNGSTTVISTALIEVLHNYVINLKVGNIHITRLCSSLLCHVIYFRVRKVTAVMKVRTAHQDPG